jgi:hypothetical protein
VQGGVCAQVADGQLTLLTKQHQKTLSHATTLEKRLFYRYTYCTVEKKIGGWGVERINGTGGLVKVWQCWLSKGMGGKGRVGG